MRLEPLRVAFCRVCYLVENLGNPHCPAPLSVLGTGRWCRTKAGIPAPPFRSTSPARRRSFSARQRPGVPATKGRSRLRSRPPWRWRRRQADHCEQDRASGRATVAGWQDVEVSRRAGGEPLPHRPPLKRRPDKTLAHWHQARALIRYGEPARDESGTPDNHTQAHGTLP
jgi:hypothetical protein